MKRLLFLFGFFLRLFSFFGNDVKYVILRCLNLDLKYCFYVVIILGGIRLICSKLIVGK